MSHGAPGPRAARTRVLAVLVTALFLSSTGALFLEDVGTSEVGDADVVPLEGEPGASTETVEMEQAALARPAPTRALAKPAKPAKANRSKRKRSKAKPSKARRSKRGCVRAPARRGRRGALRCRAVASTASRSASAGVAAAPGRASTYGGMGTWVDVYDWSHTYTGGRPGMSPDDVDRMADRGVQTMYIQASRFNAPGDGPLEPGLLQAYIGRAHARGINVVAWYLPNFVDMNRDIARLVAIGRLPVDGVGVDIEATDVGDVNERNRRLIELSSSVRSALPGRQLAAIVLPPVVTDVLNPNYWPGFPYQRLAPYYDVWMPMSYWTNRTAASGYRDAYRYTRENVDRLRSRLGGAAVHPIGGIGNGTSSSDIRAFRQAVIDTGSIGGSLYDWRTTGSGLWPEMQGLRR